MPLTIGMIASFKNRVCDSKKPSCKRIIQIPAPLKDHPPTIGASRPQKNTPVFCCSQLLGSL